MTKLNKDGVLYEFVCPNCGKGTLRAATPSVVVDDFTTIEMVEGSISTEADSYPEIDEAAETVVGCKACGHVLEGVTDPEEVVKDDRFWRKIKKL